MNINVVRSDQELEHCHSHSNRNVKVFEDLRVDEIIDKRLWNLPLVEKGDYVFHVLDSLRFHDHIWVIDSIENRTVIGIITEHDIILKYLSSITLFIEI